MPPPRLLLSLLSLISFCLIRYIDRSVKYFNPSTRLSSFIEFAKKHPECMRGELLKCPCILTSCQNTHYRSVDDVKFHVMKYGFVQEYFVWIHHGEDALMQQAIEEFAYGNVECSSVQRMVTDVAGPAARLFGDENFDEEAPNKEAPNKEAQNFYDMKKAFGLGIRNTLCCMHLLRCWTLSVDMELLCL